MWNALDNQLSTLPTRKQLILRRDLNCPLVAHPLNVGTGMDPLAGAQCMRTCLRFRTQFNIILWRRSTPGGHVQATAFFIEIMLPVLILCSHVYMSVMGRRNNLNICTKPIFLICASEPWSSCPSTLLNPQNNMFQSPQRRIHSMHISSTYPMSRCIKSEW